MNEAQERLAYLRLARTETIGPITFHRLMSKYGAATRVVDALPDLLRGKTVNICSPDAALAEIDALTKLGGQMIYKSDAAYPPTLAAIEDAPVVLSVLGDANILQRDGVALVGSRNASLNGRKLASIMASDLGAAGMVVTSGLARGIDTAAHEGALMTGTIAVVAGGVDVIYPRENTALYKTICERGAVVSECALGMQPLAQHFPKRNRIVSGLSAGVVVVEANVKSGSLITARMAGEQGRDVMAVPGFPLDPRSSGTNALIRDGAALVRDAADVLEQVNSFLKNSTPTDLFSVKNGFSEEDLPLSSEPLGAEIRQMIADLLGTTPVLVDEIIQSCNLRSADVQGALLEMELEGSLQRLPGNRVCLI